MKSYLSFDTKVKLKKLQFLPPHIHFIGIGGIGMSALAMILAKNGYMEYPFLARITARADIPIPPTPMKWM